MDYTYFSPQYGLYVTEDKRIFTPAGELLRITETERHREHVKYGAGIRVPLYSLNEGLIRLDGQKPFKRPFMNSRKKALLPREECAEYIYHLYNDKGMSIVDIAVAFGCSKSAVSDKIDRYLHKLMYSSI